MQPPAVRNGESRCRCPAERRIVLIGASVRAAAQSASRAGFCVTGLDLFGDRDTLDACHQYFPIPVPGHADSELNLARIRDACQGSYLVEVGGLGGDNSVIRQLSGCCPLIGPTAETRAQLRDPRHLRDLAVTSGMRFPRTEKPQSDANALDVPGRWLIKQGNSCGGLGVRWWQPNAVAGPEGWIQQWVPGRSFGATLLATADQVILLGVCRSLFTRRSQFPFVYAGSLGPVTVPTMLAETLGRLGKRVVAETELRGIFNVDFVVDRQGDPWLLEINPRWSGSSELIERSLIDRHQLPPGNSLFDWAVQATDQAPSSWQRRWDRSLTFLSDARWKRAEGPRTAAEDSKSRQDYPAYLKRIIYARVGLRFDLKRFDPFDSRKRGSNGQGLLHDLPSDGTIIQRAAPMMTLISPVTPNAKNPMRTHRVLVNEIHAAARRCGSARQAD